MYASLLDCTKNLSIISESSKWLLDIKIANVFLTPGINYVHVPEIWEGKMAARVNTVETRVIRMSIIVTVIELVDEPRCEWRESND